MNPTETTHQTRTRTRTQDQARHVHTLNNTPRVEWLPLPLPHRTDLARTPIWHLRTGEPRKKNTGSQETESSSPPTPCLGLNHHERAQHPRLQLARNPIPTAPSSSIPIPDHNARGFHSLGGYISNKLSPLAKRTNLGCASPCHPTWQQPICLVECLSNLVAGPTDRGRGT